MIQRNGKNLSTIVYFDNDGVKKVIKTIHKALSDGSLRLLWQSGFYLIVTPKVVWATEQESILDVQSNVNWEVI